jgi:CelD/BcsL family acetyltransferase involved in cellulose biosynthesis
MTAGGDLSAEVVTSPQAMLALEPDWTRLWAAQPRREVFTGFAWSRASLEAAGPSRTPHLVVVRRGEGVVGILPLASDGRELRFLGTEHADYNDLLVVDDASAAVVERALRAALGAGAGRCVLDNLPEWSTLCRSLDQLPAGLRARIGVVPGPPCPALRLDQDREAVLGALLGKQSLKRHEKKLARLGRLELRHLTDRDAIRERLPDFFDQHVARRAMAGEPSLFLEPAARDFYHRLVERFDPAHELRFAVLTVDDRAVAYHLGFELGGRFTWYKPTFDVDLWDYGTGEVLLKRLLEYAREHPIVEFDFTRGAESFKDRFSNHAGRNVRWTLHASATAARWSDLRRSTRARLAATPWIAALRGRAAAHDAQDKRRTRASVERLALSAVRGRLTAGPSAAAGEGVVVIERASLRALSRWAAAGTPWFGLADMASARERLSQGEVAYLGLDGDALRSVAWLGTRSEIPGAGEEAPGPRLPLPGPTSIIEPHPGPDDPATIAMVQALIVAMAREATGEEIWLLLDARRSAWRTAASRLGFHARGPIDRSWHFGRPSPLRPTPEGGAAPSPDA